ncbi:MAG: hypothetical protein QOD78_2582 [Chloroflexota bacterium]|nr:hypothetical protein [Chloroflexota bacterium]
MSKEPTGHTIDGTPWEEPRPPHPPDALTRVSPWLLPFAAVAAYQLWLLWVAQPRESGPGFNIQYWLDARRQIPAIAISLIGLALFIRHRDARSAMPQLVSGAFLLLAQRVMLLLVPTLDPFFLSLTSPGDDFAFFSPLSEAYRILTTLVGIFGITFVASGLSAARRYESPGMARALPLFVAVSACVSEGFSVLGLMQFQFDAAPGQILTIAGTLVANLLATLAAGYLFIVSLTGWLGQESPRLGWRLAAIGSGLLLLGRLLAPVLSVLPIQDVLLAVGQLLFTGSIVGWIGLLFAFAMGLPSTSETSDADQADVAEATTDSTASTTRDSAVG